MKIKNGIGFDAHRFAEDRTLVIGGVTIPFELGLAGHSDADVLIHAVIDAVVGPVLATDIGGLFPDTDSAYKDIDSRKLLAAAMERIRERGWNVSHVDATVIAQVPKLAPFITSMREELARVMQVPMEDVTVKATTTEKMGYTGRKEGIAAIASATLLKNG